jgi:hypothetical protein
VSASQVGWDDVVSAAPQQVSNRVGDEVAILSLDRGVYYGLNPVGARIWELIRTPTPVSALHAVILEEYDVDADRARQDLLEVLDRLLEAGLIERRPHAG